MIGEWTIKAGSWLSVLGVSGFAGVQMAKTGFIPLPAERQLAAQVEVSIRDNDGLLASGETFIVNFSGVKNVLCARVQLVVFGVTTNSKGISYRYKLVDREVANIGLGAFDVNWEFAMPLEEELPPGQFSVMGHLSYSGCNEPTRPVTAFVSNKVELVESGV